MTTFARFQKASPIGSDSGASGRVLLLPRATLFLMSLSVYFTDVFFVMISNGLLDKSE